MKSVKIENVFAFIRFTQKFRAVVRDVKIGEENRFENDMEHSYQLAILLWYLCTVYKLDYQVDKLICYSLIHDLVETYAGDTPALTSSADKINSKLDREDIALREITREFPEFKEFKRMWREYKSKIDKESRLVYVIDKVMPVLNELQQDSGFYKKNKITLDKWKAWLKSKMNMVDYKKLDDAGFVEILLNYLENKSKRMFSSGDSKAE